MGQFLKNSIFILFLSTLVCSCHEENKFKWENAVVRSEKDAIIISSFDIVSLIQKSNLSENEELNFSQKMMVRAATSSLASSSTGFRIEGQHYILVVPKSEEINGGVFYPGKITNYRKFSSNLQDIFGENNFSKNQVNFLYNADYNIMLGFNSDHFIIGSSNDTSFLKEKISFYFTINQSEIQDPFLEEFLSYEEDLCFYYDGQKTSNYISNLSSPYLTAWLPFFKFQDKKAMLKTAFNKGTVKLSYFTENKEKVNVEDHFNDTYKSYFLDSSFLNAEHCFNNTTINNFIKKEFNHYVNLDSLLSLTATYLSLTPNSLKSIENLALSLKKPEVSNLDYNDEMGHDWESEQYWDDDDFESSESEIPNSFDWLISIAFDSSFQSATMLNEPVFDRSVLHKTFTKNSLYLSNDSTVINNIQYNMKNGYSSDIIESKNVVSKLQLNLNNLSPLQNLTNIFIPYNNYIDISSIKNMEIVGNLNNIIMEITLNDKESNALHILTKDFWKILVDLKMI